MGRDTCTNPAHQPTTRRPPRLERPILAQPPTLPPSPSFAGAPILQSLRGTIAPLRRLVFPAESSID
ncbi:hypothetical protein HID58_089605 [Brassica napus]|uniref:Uncharacterized protein n=1 Tax=Brassica napus TaxID=3708 RepID=A0ABQ7Y0X0_BRANA|nr:hypothetical protein HID58_089605 [Brassica napus]